MKFIALRVYWKAFFALPKAQQLAAREKFKIFKEDPFHHTLGTHEIKKLSKMSGKTIYSVVIQGNLRSLFYKEGKDTYVSIMIGNHNIYK